MNKAEIIVFMKPLLPSIQYLIQQAEGKSRLEMHQVIVTFLRVHQITDIEQIVVLTCYIQSLLDQKFYNAADMVVLVR